MKSVMTHQFSQVPRANIPRSSFDRSHGHKTTFDASKLVPIFVDEALPGDTFNLNMTGFARMATPIFPIMDNMFMETFFFSVPIRLVWDNWQKFNGEQKNPGDSIDYTVPRFVGGGYKVVEGKISDYFGLPIDYDLSNCSSLFHRAYGLIYNEWFRDQNLIDSVPVATDDGPDQPGVDVPRDLLNRCKRHDYFTSSLPWPQKGDSIQLPLGQRANVTFDGLVGSIPTVKVTNSGFPSDNSSIESHGANTLSTIDGSGLSSDQLLYADLSTATAATVNQLRQAFQIQKLQERDARGGSRYVEIIKSHFGVTSPDQRLQRPEFLGGGSSPVIINPVQQTSSTDTTSPQGNLAATGTATLRNHGFTKSFTEHCIVIGLVNVRADLTYQQGINRMFSRQTRYDYYWPALAQIGEQAVLNKEIYSDGTAADEDVFGYQERYAEYRYKPSLVTGKMRSSVTGSLDAWHLSQDFGSRPVLDKTFIEENVPMSRVEAVPSEPDFIFDSYFKFKCVRPMPIYGVPGLMDHF